MSDSDRKNTRIAPERRRRSGEQPSRRPRVAGSRRPAERTVTPSEFDATPADAANSPADAANSPADGGSATTADVQSAGVDLTKQADPGTVDAPTTEKAAATTGDDTSITPEAPSGYDAAVPPPSAPDALPPPAPPASTKTAGIGGIRRSIWVLVAVAAILAGLIVVAAIRPGVHTGDSAWVDEAGTGEVLDAAKNGLATVLSYNFETIEQDQDNARAVLTGDMREEYDVTAGATRDFANEVKASATAIVDPTAVTLFDGNRAEIVASVTVNAVIDGVDQGFVVTPVAASLELVDGQWLIADVLDR